jgi:hypothetical protein
MGRPDHPGVVDLSGRAADAGADEGSADDGSADHGRFDRGGFDDGPVEFLGTAAAVAGAEEGGSEDVLEHTPRRAPRWVVALACAALAAGAVAAVAGNEHRTGGNPSAAGSTPRAEPVRMPAVEATLGEVVPTDSKPVLDVVVTPNRTWILQAGQLVAIPASGRIERVPITGLDFTPVLDSVRLVPDLAAGRLWLVVLGTPGGPVIEYDLALQRLRTVRPGPPTTSAAALDGHLYLAAESDGSAGIGDLAPGASVLSRIRAPGVVTSLAADPSRSRLLALSLVDAGTSAPGARVLQLWPGRQLSASAQTLPFGKGGIAVTGDGAVWAGGYGAGGAVLVRVDPASLRTVTRSPVAPDLGPGANLVAAGTHTIWLRSGAGGSALYCLDAHTGAGRQVWSNAPGRVGSVRGVAYLATGAAVVRLPLDSCAG